MKEGKAGSCPPLPGVMREGENNNATPTQRGAPTTIQETTTNNRNAATNTNKHTVSHKKLATTTTTTHMEGERHFFRVTSLARLS